MEIRFLNGGDAGEYWRLRLEALQGDPEAFSSSAEEHQSLSLDEVGRRLGSDGADSFVVGAFDGGSLIGTAGFLSREGTQSTPQGTRVGRVCDAREPR